MAKHFVSNSSESVRMFKSDLIESLSKIHWSVPLIFYIPVISIFLFFSFSKGLGLVVVLFLFILGALIWSLTEYLLHRFVFHYHPSSDFGKRVHWLFHGVHHDYPQDRLRLVMPLSISIPLGVLFYFLFGLILNEPKLYPFFAGFLAGYLAYDTLHYAVHHFAFRNKFMLSLKKHHMKHHYSNPEAGYGVSSPLWDSIFKT